MKMTQAEKRKIAAGAARCQIKRCGNDPDTAPVESAFCALSELMQFEPQLVASQWWKNATPNQEKLFIQEWNKENQWRKTYLTKP